MASPAVRFMGRGIKQHAPVPVRLTLFCNGAAVWRYGGMGGIAEGWHNRYGSRMLYFPPVCGVAVSSERQRHPSGLQSHHTPNRHRFRTVLMAPALCCSWGRGNWFPRPMHRDAECVTVCGCLLKWGVRTASRSPACHAQLSACFSAGHGTCRKRQRPGTAKAGKLQPTQTSVNRHQLQREPYNGDA